MRKALRGTLNLMCNFIMSFIFEGEKRFLYRLEKVICLIVLVVISKLCTFMYEKFLILSINNRAKNRFAIKQYFHTYRA